MLSTSERQAPFTPNGRCSSGRTAGALRGLPALLALLFVSSACGRSPESNAIAQPAERRFPLTGIVVGGPDPDGRLSIAHDAVRGFMPAMVMPFEVRGLPPDVGNDDRVSATLVVTADRTWIEALVVTRQARAASASRSTLAATVGTPVPNFRLRNQDDVEVAMQSYRGRVVLLTFIYTRCPLPDYCPRLMAQFGAVKRALARRPEVWEQVQMLSVTIDPAVDTPAALRAYGQRHILGPAPFDHWDLATGSDTEIRAMAGFFGLQHRPEGGVIVHSLATAIVGRDGRLVATLPSNTWSVDDVVRWLAEAVESVSGTR